MKKLIGVLGVILALAFPLFAPINTTAFLATAVAVGAGATSTNGVEFTSRHIQVSLLRPEGVCSVTVTFTRTTGTTADVDFNIQASYDDGTTWSTTPYVTLSLDTSTTAVSNVVRSTHLVYCYGITHLRLSSIVNNDGATALTACNATVTVRN